MTTQQHIPTRAEFIRDRLAEWCDGYGYDTATYTSNGVKVLSVESVDLEMDVEVATSGALTNRDTGEPVRMRGFTWTAEPTDTGQMHGPHEASAIYPTFGQHHDTSDVVAASHRAYLRLTAMAAHVRLVGVDTGRVHGPREA